MDELDLIERFRADVPEAGLDTRAGARASLMDAMSQRRIERMRLPRRIPRRAWAGAAALVGAALVVALAAPMLLPGGRETSAAAEALRSAALVAARQPSATVEPGQYVYTKTKAMWRSITCDGPEVCTTEFEDVVREIWIARDGSGRINETRGGEHWDQTFDPGGLYFEDLSNLPTEVEALRSWIEERAALADPPTDYEMFIVIGDLLRETYASPELRAALYEVAATLPRVELLGQVADEEGRPGIGVGYTYLGIRQELIFDPKTSGVLGERQVQVDPPVNDASPPPGVGVNQDGVDDPGTLLGWAVYLESGIVDSVDEPSRPSM